MGQVRFVTLPKCQMEDLSTKLTNNVVERLRQRQVNRPLSIGTPLSKTRYQCSVYHIGHCSRSLEHQSTCFCLRMSVCFGIIGCSCELMVLSTKSLWLNPGPRPTGSCAYPVHSGAKRQLTWRYFGRREIIPPNHEITLNT